MPLIKLEVLIPIQPIILSKRNELAGKIYGFSSSTDQCLCATSIALQKV
jgi:hypothetical protein